MNRKALVTLAFLGVFIAGAITGGLVGVRVAQTFSRNRATEQFVQQQLKRIADHLSLTPEQRQRIRPIVIAAGRDVQEHRREIFAVTEKMETEIRQILTEQQRVEFDRMRSRLRENEKVFQRWIREQRARRLDALTGPSSNVAPEESRAAPTGDPATKP